MLLTSQTGRQLSNINAVGMNKKIWMIITALPLIVSIASCTGKDGDAQKPKHSQHGADAPAPEKMEMVTLSKRDEQYANITVDTVKRQAISEYTTLVGTTSIDERNVSVITSRIRGRLEKLFVRNPQENISKGMPLYAIYSEELLSDENELLNVLRQEVQLADMKQVMAQLVEAARKKLLLWGLSREQITQIEQSGEASPLITIHSPIGGTLVDLSVSEGQYVEIGTPLFRLADLSQLWIEAQMYTGELRWLTEQPIITADFDAYPNQVFSVTPVFDNPSVEPDQKISLVRFLISNKSASLKPGMMAYVNIKRNQKYTMVIPKSSILVGNMVTAWVKKGDGMYENRVIQLGIQNKKEVEVTGGLKEGELVVTSGAYLLNSALVLKKGTGMEGMKM